MAQPVPGMKILPPFAPPAPGQVIVRYDMVQPEVGCCKCDTLSQKGWIIVIILVLIFWPAAFIPCCQAGCHEPSQRPVYDHPGAYGQPGMPVAMPVGAPVPMGAPVPKQEV